MQRGHGDPAAAEVSEQVVEDVAVGARDHRRSLL
jgi:hypothetical protein